MKKLILIFAVFQLTCMAFSQTKVDSILHLCEKASDVKKADYYLELSLLTRDDTTKSNAYNRLAYHFATEQNQLKNQAKALYYFGETGFYTRNFAYAIPYYEKAIPIYEQLKDTFLLTNCYSSIGLCYHNIFQGEKAIATFLKALKISEKDKEYSAEITANIAVAHARMDNHQDAIYYFRKALKLNLDINDSVSIAVDYNGLGEAFNNLNKSDSAIANFHKAMVIFKKTKKTGYEAIALANLASIYPNYPDSINKAIQCLNRASAKFRELGWDLYEADIQNEFGNIYCKKGDFGKAIDSYRESLILTDQFNRGFGLKQSNYNGLFQVYEKTGDFKKALEYHVLYAQYTDSLVKKEKYEQIVNLEKQYETEKKENEITKLHARQDLMNVQLRKNKQLKQLGYVTTILLLGFVFFVLIKYQDKIKSNQILAEKNRIIAESEQELRLINAAKNKFFSIIAHDLKNPLHSILGYSSLLSNDYDKFTESERRKFAGDINQSTNNIFRLLQNLLEWSRSQTGQLTFEPLEVELKNLLRNSVNVLYSSAEQKNISINFEYDEELKLFADPLMIETVLRNLINNAIKFTPENGQISIAAKKTEHEIEIRVTDTGVGIPEADRQNLFRIDSKVKRKGTNNEDGSGLGLILCREFVEKNNGTIWVESIPGHGSSFCFTIPAKKIA